MTKDTVEIFNDWLESKLTNIHTIIPGKIVEYSGHAERKAKVKPLVKVRTINNEVVEIEEIENTPVIFPSTAEFSFLFPLKKDDGVLLLFSEAGIGNFLNSDTVEDPDDANRFDLTDCIAIPGMWSFKTVPDAPENDDDFWIKFQDTSINIVNSDNDLIITDKHGNTITTTADGILLEDLSGNKYESLSTGITIEDANGNTIETSATGVSINSGNHEVLQ
jgi:hypothetical protein